MLHTNIDKLTTLVSLALFSLFLCLLLN